MGLGRVLRISMLKALPSDANAASPCWFLDSHLIGKPWRSIDLDIHSLHAVQQTWLGSIQQHSWAMEEYFWNSKLGVKFIASCIDFILFFIFFLPSKAIDIPKKHAVSFWWEWNRAMELSFGICCQFLNSEAGEFWTVKQELCIQRDSGAWKVGLQHPFCLIAFLLSFMWLLKPHDLHYLTASSEWKNCLDVHKDYLFHTDL